MKSRIDFCRETSLETTLFFPQGSVTPRKKRERSHIRVYTFSIMYPVKMCRLSLCLFFASFVSFFLFRGGFADSFGDQIDSYACNVNVSHGIICEPMPVPAPDFQIKKSGTTLGHGWDEQFIEEPPYPILSLNIGRKPVEERITHHLIFRVIQQLF